jgi:radical SAM enzyme (TIGR01210 family)
MNTIATKHRNESNPKETTALDRVQFFAKKYRMENGTAAEAVDYGVPVGYEERIGHIDGEPVPRLIIFLRSTGCEWVEKTGGCTMCGFYSATNRGMKISTDDYCAQLEHVMQEVDLQDYPVVSIYNDGNIFNEAEISMEAVEGMCAVLNRFSGIRKVVFESRIDYSPIDRVKNVKKCLDGKLLEVAFGFESADPQVMNLCINKGLSAHNFDYFYSVMQNTGVLLKPLLLLKPPFLTERESVEDLLATIRYLAAKQIRDIDLEVMTVEQNTVVYNLWKQGLYTTPMLWSIVDLIERYRAEFGDRVNLYISPWNYSVESLDWSKNCGRCDEEVGAAIHAYNHAFDPATLADLDCSCRQEIWMPRMEQTDDRPIPDRILDQLGVLERAAKPG